MLGMGFVRVYARRAIFRAMPRPHTRPATPFGQYLVDAAIRAGHSDITSWGESLGIKASMVSDYRSGRRNPPGKAIEKWAKSLGLSGNQLTRFYIFAAAERSPKQLRPILRLVPDLLDSLETKLQGSQAKVQELSARLESLERGD